MKLIMGLGRGIPAMQGTERWVISLRTSGSTVMCAISNSTDEFIGVSERVTFSSLTGGWRR